VNKADHFSCQLTDYSLYRPSYPLKLFQHLVSLCPSDELAWDCATGTGQAAAGLARVFKKVIATDISAAQIEEAQSEENIVYKVASAEHSGIDSQSIDLIMVAQAFHWFDFELFYTEAKRVLKPEGVLSVVSYQLPRINADIDTLIDEFHHLTLGHYWPAERRHVDNAYRDIPFPLLALPPPSLQMEQYWTLTQFLGYLRSWSAVVYFGKEKKRNPIDFISKQLSTLWGDADKQMPVYWPLTIRIGNFDTGTT
jgi:SAM-dependent methyltransferase